jgi:hypothetical protein
MFVKLSPKLNPLSALSSRLAVVPASSLVNIMLVVLEYSLALVISREPSPFRVVLLMSASLWLRIAMRGQSIFVRVRTGVDFLRGGDRLNSSLNFDFLVSTLQLWAGVMPLSRLPSTDVLFEACMPVIANRLPELDVWSLTAPNFSD